MHDPTCDQRDALEPLRSLLYRYWFWGWLFCDASQGSVYTRHAAWRHNVAQRHHLPTYMRRWFACVGGTFLVGRGLEIALGATPATATLYTAAVLASCVLTVAATGWALLARAGE